MAFVLDKVSEDTFYENIFLGLTKILERNTQIKDVHLERIPACPASEVAFWEQAHSLKLPEELRDFYLSSNGLNLSWKYIFSDQEILPVGLIKIRPLNELVLSKHNLQVVPELKPLKSKLYQHCNNDAKTLYLANVDDTTKVCLVYSNNSRISPNIYLIENDMACYYLTNSFKKYLLMAIAHLGLPLWQFCFTPQGIPSWVEQMFIMIAPHLETAHPVLKLYEDGFCEDKKETHYQHNKLDTNIFKIKHRSSKNSDNIIKYRKRQHLKI